MAGKRGRQGTNRSDMVSFRLLGRSGLGFGEQTDIRWQKSKQKEKYDEENSQKIYGCSFLIYFCRALQLPCTEKSGKHADKKYQDICPCNIVSQDT